MNPPRHHTSCAAEGCRTQITQYWYCKDHWFGLPQTLQRALLDAYRAARKAHCRAGREDQERLNRAYGVAFRACQDHLAAARRTVPPVAYEDGRAVRYAQGRRL